MTETRKYGPEKRDTGQPQSTKSPFHKRMRLSIFISGGVGLAILALMVIMTIFILRIKHDFALKSSRANAGFIAGLVGQHADRTIFGIENILDGLSSTINISDQKNPDNDKKINETLLAIRKQNPFLMDLLILDSLGDILHWTGSGSPPFVRDRDYAKEHLVSHVTELFIGSPKLSRVHEGKWFIGISKSNRTPEGRLKTIQVGIVDLNFFFRIFANLEYPHGASFGLTSAEGLLITHVPNHHRFVGNKFNEIEAIWNLGRTKGFITLVSPMDRQKRLVCYTRVSHYPILAFCSFPEKLILKDWHEDIFLFSSFTLLISIVLAGATAMVIRVQLKLSAKQEEMDRMALTEPLTGLDNRKHFSRKAIVEAERCKRYNGKLAVLAIDIDKFRSINRKMGYAAGDEVLKQLSRLLSSSFRTNDLICRSGDDEFLVILPAAGKKEALSVAELTRSRVEFQRFQAPDSPVKITISIGIAIWEESDDNINHVFERAFKALSSAKEAGKNRISNLWKNSSSV